MQLWGDLGTGKKVGALLRRLEERLTSFLPLFFSSPPASMYIQQYDEYIVVLAC